MGNGCDMKKQEQYNPGLTYWDGSTNLTKEERLKQKPKLDKAIEKYKNYTYKQLRKSILKEGK